MIKTYVYTICSKQGKNNYRKQLATVVLTVVLENNNNKPILRISQYLLVMLGIIGIIGVVLMLYTKTGENIIYSLPFQQ